mgnify:FL=1
MVPTVLVNLAIELNLRKKYTAKRMPNQCDNEVPQAAVITSCKKGGSQTGRYPTP